MAQNTAGRGSTIDARVTRHREYSLGQTIRKRIEEAFGWGKEVGPLRRIRVRGRARVDMVFSLGATAFNLVRLPKLLAA